jgi:hypothetical protein
VVKLTPSIGDQLLCWCCAQVSLHQLYLGILLIFVINEARTMPVNKKRLISLLLHIIKLSIDYYSNIHRSILGKNYPVAGGLLGRNSPLAEVEKIGRLEWPYFVYF